MLYPNARLVEQCQVQMLLSPTSLLAGANEGAWVSMKNFDRLVIIFAKGAGKAGEDPVLTLLQGKFIEGSSPDREAKALDFTRIDVKKGGVSPGVGGFTKVTQAAANTYTDTTSAEVEGLFILEVRADELDRENGYDCVQFSMPDVGGSPSNPQKGCVIGILTGARYGGASLPSAIVD